LRVETDRGVAWLSRPEDCIVGVDLYGGTSGIVAFLLELHAATGDASALTDACAGAAEILAHLGRDHSSAAGLYDGLAGNVFMLSEVYRSTGKPEFRAGMLRALDLLRSRARTIGDGVEWNDCADVLTGTAGIGLALLHMFSTHGEESALHLSVRAGRRLLALARASDGGLTWQSLPHESHETPNFAHGTAGVAYFLATLAILSGERVFLAAAARGATYLLRIANTENDGFLVGRHSNGGERLYYLGWCHGPAGTMRLFHRLGEATGDRRWDEWVLRGARSIATSGIPERRTAGFWNTVSMCCGTAGVAEFFLALHGAYGRPELLVFAHRLAADIMYRATDDGEGLRWYQRVDREGHAAPAGYMQGAAGVGTVLLRFDSHSRRLPARITFPDSPWCQ